MRILFSLCFIVLVSAPALACIGNDVNVPSKLAQHQSADFERHDMNHDGQVTVGEYVQANSVGNYGGSVKVHPFIKHDANKSGAVMFDEWKNFRILSYYEVDDAVECNNGR